MRGFLIGTGLTLLGSYMAWHYRNDLEGIIHECDEWCRQGMNKMQEKIT